ncbi:unnamed protein product, partial [Mesorhabditis spiculigera]
MWKGWIVMAGLVILVVCPIIAGQRLDSDVEDGQVEDVVHESAEAPEPPVQIEEPESCTTYSESAPPCCGSPAHLANTHYLLVSGDPRV